MLCQLQGRLNVVLVPATMSSAGNGSLWIHWSVNPISGHWTSNLTSDGQHFDLFCFNISVVLIRQDPKHETMREEGVVVGVSFDQDPLLVRDREDPCTSGACTLMQGVAFAPDQEKSCGRSISL